MCHWWNINWGCLTTQLNIERISHANRIKPLASNCWCWEDSRHAASNLFLTDDYPNVSFIRREHRPACARKSRLCFAKRNEQETSNTTKWWASVLQVCTDTALICRLTLRCACGIGGLLEELEIIPVLDGSLTDHAALACNTWAHKHMMPYAISIDYVPTGCLGEAREQCRWIVWCAV